MIDPDDILRKLASRSGPERRLLEAGWRFQLIAPLLDDKNDKLSRQKKRTYRRDLLEGTVEHPWRGLVSLSARNLRRWCQRYRELGMAGLVPEVRANSGKSVALPEGALEFALALREEDGRRGVPQLIRLMEADRPAWAGKISRSTLDRHLRARGSKRQRTVVPEGPFRTFEANEPNELWQGDILVGPVVLLKDGSAKRCRVVCWLDDHARYVTHLEAYADEKLASIEDALCRAILKYGLPSRLFVDNALVYSGTSFGLACSELGIHKIHSTPRYPVSRGKQERFFSTLRQQLLNEVENLEPLPLEQLNRYLVAWTSRYHHTEHSTIEQTPAARFAARAHRLVDSEKLQFAFLQWDIRSISCTGQIKFGGNLYQTDPSLACRKAVIRFDPHDLTRIFVWKDGRRVATASHLKLVHATIPGKPARGHCKASETARKLLEQYEQGHRQALAQEVNRTEYRAPGKEDVDHGDAHTV